MKTADVDDSSAPVSSSNNNVVPLRTVLQNFLNLVESYESQRSFGADAYEKEFQELKIFSENLKSDPDYQCKEGEKSVSRKKNRYKDILPFDYTRVTLTPTDDVPGSDYINANFIKGASGSSAYIACQGPLAHTVNDFWKMVVECEVQVIVMACMEQESGKHKCEKYWVEEDDIEKQFGDVTVWLKKCRNVCPDFLVRTMRIRYTNARKEKEERNVCQFHYSAWPDHGIPNRVSPLLDMVRLIRDCQTSETLPVLVHCSAGCGRTGTICAIDYVWGLLRLGKLTADFSLFQLVKDMRRQRIAMVQTKDQYILVHRAVKELFQEQLKIIDAHIYANLDPNGFPFKTKLDMNSTDEPTYEIIEFDNEFRTTPQGDFASELTRGGSFTNSGSSGEPTTSKSNSSKASGSVRLKRNEAAMNALLGRDSVNDNKKFNGLGDEDEICVVEDNSIKTEPVTAPSSASKSASGLLRKPSIIKLKQFFERTPKESKQKKGSTQLSRAKSDVSSSRFYSFTSSFGNSKQSASPNSGSVVKAKESVAATSVPTETNDNKGPEKAKKTVNGKPPLFAKPILPIKRSKSLKVNMESSHSDAAPIMFTNTEINSRTPDSNSFDRVSASGSPTGGFSSLVMHNPIKVSVRQMESPKAQSIISSSVKPQSYTAIQSMDEPRASESPPRKPSPPSLADAKKFAPNNYVNVGYGGNKVKVGIAKEMEDVGKPTSGSSSRSRAAKKKYDTVNSRTFAMMSSEEPNSTGLSRSQSHVWQQDKLKLTDRMFSDDNLIMSRPGELFTTGGSAQQSKLELGESKQLNSRVMKVKPLVPEGNRGNNDSVTSDASDNQDQGKQIDISESSSSPVVRGRVPRTNPYTNFSLNCNDRYSPLLKKYEDTRSAGPTSVTSQRSKETIPQLRNHIRTISTGNSSESSNSNTGTPKDSLPSTPSQSIDGLYFQHGKSNSAFKHQSGLPKSTYPSRDMGGLVSISITSKPILKGSLSSSSESDDRVDGAKLLLSKSRTSPLYSSINPVSLTAAPPKMASGRAPLGIRERRNSFRQAVWKEAQNDGHQYHSTSPPKQNSLQQLTQSQPFPLSHSSSNSISSTYATPTFNLASERQPLKTRRDYEPIWPDDNANPVHVSSTYVSKDHYDGMDTGAYYNKNDQQLRPTFPDSNTLSVNFNESHFQHKLEEIKILLEGLNTSAPASTNSNNSNAGSRSNNLKYHRSLKSPSRSQYLQQNPEGGGLSCFSFKKTNSFESISDQFELADGERLPLVQDKSPFTFFSDAQNRSNNGSGNSGGYQSNALFGRNYSSSAIEGPSGTFWNDNTDVTPVRPPRTKVKRNLGQEYKSSADDGVRQQQRHEMGRTNLSIWSNSDIANSTSHLRNLNLNKTATSSTGDNDYEQQQSISNGNISDSSPKPLSRALGAFQATAASVRSKFANWSEPKDKSHGFKSQTNGESNPADENGGFTSPKYTFANPVVLKSTSSGQLRTTKHQYL